MHLRGMIGQLSFRKNYTPIWLRAFPYRGFSLQLLNTGIMVGAPSHALLVPGLPPSVAQAPVATLLCLLLPSPLLPCPPLLLLLLALCLVAFFIYIYHTRQVRQFRAPRWLPLA